MKYNILKILFVFMIIFISGCAKTNDNQINYKKYNYNYELNSDNLSKFYEFSNTFNTIEGGFELRVILTPKLELAAKDLKISGEYVVNYREAEEEDTKSITYTFELDSSSKDKITKLFSVINPAFNNFSLHSIEIIEVEGTVYTNEVVDLKQLNKENYDKLVLDMEAFENRTVSNYCSIYTTVENKSIKNKEEITTETSANEVKFRISPFYMESGNIASKTIIMEEDGGIFQYHINTDKIDSLYWVSKLKLDDAANLDEYNDFENIFEASDFDKDELDYNKLTIEIIGNNYIIKGNYKDLLPEDEFNELQDLYTSLGVSESVLNDSTFKITIKLEDSRMAMETSAVIPINTNEIDEIENITTIIIDFDEIEIINVYDKENYFIRIPSSFDEVNDYTNVLDEVNVQADTFSQYFKTHFEEGQYYYNDYDNNISLTIYDTNKNKVEFGVFFEQYDKGNHESTFTIPKGDYYIQINNYDFKNYKFKFEKLEYNSIYDLDNPIVIQEGTLSFDIEGEYDLFVADYYSDKEGILEVTNNTNVFANVYYNNGKTTGLVNESFGDGRHYAITKGHNYFYFYGDTTSFEYKIKFIDVDAYKDKYNIKDISEIDEWIITGPKLSSSLFKIELNKKTTFTFYFERMNQNSSFPELYIYDINSHQRFYSSYDPNTAMLLHAGTYYMCIDSSNIAIAKFNYTLVELADDIENVELKSFPTNNVLDPSFPKYEGRSITNDQISIFGKRFTLDETSNVLIYSHSTGYILYDNDKNKLSFDEFKDVQGGVIYKLKPGTYTIQIKTQYDFPDVYSLSMAILSGELEDDYPYDPYNLREIELGIISTTKNYSNDVDVLKLTVTEDTIYIMSPGEGITASIINIYNEKMEFIGQMYRPGEIELNFINGTYYFVTYPPKNIIEITYNLNKK